jgi:hypothetical protein
VAKNLKSFLTFAALSQTAGMVPGCLFNIKKLIKEKIKNNAREKKNLSTS